MENRIPPRHVLSTPKHQRTVCWAWQGTLRWHTSWQRRQHFVAGCRTWQWLYGWGPPFCTPDSLAEKPSTKIWQWDLPSCHATYKTRRYALPLFFLCVKTNVDYCVVGSFVVQRETKNATTAALQVLHNRNPLWSPKFFMTDFSDPEIRAIEDLFQGGFSK